MPCRVFSAVNYARRIDENPSIQYIERLMDAVCAQFCVTYALKLEKINNYDILRLRNKIQIL